MSRPASRKASIHARPHTRNRTPSNVSAFQPTSQHRVGDWHHLRRERENLELYDETSSQLLVPRSLWRWRTYFHLLYLSLKKHISPDSSRLLKTTSTTTSNSVSVETLVQSQGFASAQALNAFPLQPEYVPHGSPQDLPQHEHAVCAASRYQ